MKKLIALLIALAMIVSAALGEGLGQGLELDLGSMALCTEWEGESSATHEWLTVDATATNWNTEGVNLGEAVEATLTYMDQYSFEGVLEFPAAAVEPLVQLEGTLVFRIPQMVARNLDAARMDIAVEGRELAPQIAVSASSAGQAEGRWEGPGYDSPEAAVEAYVAYLNAGDPQGMLSTFAIETAVDHMDEKAYTERLRIWQPSAMGSIPVFNDYSRGVAILRRVGEMANTLCYGMLVQAWPEGYGAFEGMPVRFNSDTVGEEVETFYAGFAASDFAGWAGQVSVAGYLTPEELGIAEIFYSEANQANIDRQRAFYGADELAERVARLDIAGETAVQFMQCARFGDRWYNYTVISIMDLICGIDYYNAGLVVGPLDQ